MALDLGELSGRITLDDRGFTRPMQQAERGLRRLEATTRSSLDEVEGEFRRAGEGATREMSRTMDRVGQEAERGGQQAGRDAARGIERGLRRVEAPARRAGRDAGKSAGEGLAQGAEGGAKGKFGALRGKLTGIMGKAGPWLAAGAVVGGAFMTGLAGAMDKQDALAKLSAQVGAFGPRSHALGRVAGALYASAYGESMEDVTDAIRAVMQNIGGMSTASEADLKKVSAAALDLATIMDEEVGGVSRAVGTMLRTGMAKNAQEAFDILTRGVQTGANKAEDLLDTFTEYSTQFRKLGLDGQAAMGLISQGLRAGARDADTVADALKEFSIRAVDGSTTSAQGFKLLGLSAEKMTAQIAKGGRPAAEGLQLVLDRLRGIHDPVKREAAAVALFGTKAEDLGKALYSLDPSQAVATLGKVGGAAKKTGDTLHSTASQNITKFQRTLKGALVDFVGGKVLPGLTKFSDKVGPTFGRAFNEIRKWVEENQDKIQEWADKIEQIATLVGGIIDSGLTVIGVLWDKFGSTILDTIAGLVDGILGYWVGIFTMIQGVWNVFAGIFTGDWDRVWKGIKQIFSGAIKAVGSILSIGLTLIKATWRFTWELIKKFVQGVWNKIVAGVKAAARKVLDAVGWFKSLPGRVAGWFGRMKDAAVSRAKALAGWMRGLPGRIRRALGNLGSLLWGAGRNVISGLIRGIRSKLGDVGRAMSGITQKIRDHLPFSPAKEGPLSGAGSPELAGRKIGAMLAAGVTSSRGQVAAAMAGVTGTIGAAQQSAFTVRRPGGGSVVRGGDGAAAEVRVIWDIRGGAREFKRWIRETVRVEGRGDVQVAFGQRRGR